MECRIAVAELSRALSLTQGIVQRKNTMPILSHVLVSVEHRGDGMGQISIAATDLDVSIHTTRLCEVLEESSVAIPARDLADVVRVLPENDVFLKLIDNRQIQVKSGKTNAKLATIEAEAFPVLPKLENDAAFSEIDAALLADMVEKTLYAASLDEGRPNLNGVLFEPDPETPGKVTLVATDGHRLVQCSRTFDNTSFNLDNPVILPRKGLTELKRFAESDDSKTPINVGFTGNHAVFRRGQTTLSMNLVDGQFPDYKQVIPHLADKIAKIPRAPLIKSLQRVSVLASDKAQPVKLKISGDNLTVSCVSDKGEMVDDVAVEYSGQAIEIAFNARYLIEALQSVDQSDVLLKLTDSLSPGLLLGHNQTNHLCVVMPMRV